MEEISRVILILNIKLDNNRSDDLQIYEDDEPEIAAENFCKKHKLPVHVKQILIKNIEDNLDEFIKEELGNNTTVLSSIVSGVKASNTSINSHNRSSSAKNYGEVLYEKGIMMRQKVEHMIQIQKQNNLEKELKNSTFTPKINSYQPRPRTNSSKPVNKRHQRLLDQTNICTFKPKINNYRLKKKENLQGSDKCIELYNNAKNIKQRKEEKNLKIFNETYTFRPNVLKKYSGYSPCRSVKNAHNLSFIQKIKLQQNKAMFDALNPNFHGCITKATVQELSLTRAMHEKIGRIVYELIELDEELNFEEFCKAVEILEQENLNQTTKSEKIEVPDEFS